MSFVQATAVTTQRWAMEVKEEVNDVAQRCDVPSLFAPERLGTMVAPSTAFFTTARRRKIQRRSPSVSQRADGQSSAHTAREREQQASIHAFSHAASDAAAIAEPIGVAGQPYRSFSCSAPAVVQGDERLLKAGNGCER